MAESHGETTENEDIDSKVDGKRARIEMGNAGRRRPIPRKGHGKSRRGCLNCKTRKVKCTEEWPRCRSCSRRDVECEYPNLPMPVVGPSAALQTSPALVNLSDLRFFHHFIVNGHPQLPFGFGNAWQHIAAMAHEVSRNRRPGSRRIAHANFD